LGLIREKFTITKVKRIYFLISYKIFSKINKTKLGNEFQGVEMKNKCVSPVLHLMCGLPGSGKTTLAKQLSKECKAIRFSPDEWLYDLGLDFYNDEIRIRVENEPYRVCRRQFI